MKKIPFILLIVVVVCLAAATFFEKYLGRSFVEEYIYGSVWFVALWGVLALFSLWHIIKQKFYRNILAFLLHLSFLVILLGALVTFLTAKRGLLQLRVGEGKSEFVVYEKKKERYVEMPLTIKLDAFTVKNYPGTDAPADYVSTVKIHDNKSGTSFTEDISMNKILSHKGYRFYQSSYDNDGQGSWLSVNTDPWGIAITYTGYFLLFLSMIWILVAPKGRFLQLLRSPLLKKGLMTVVLLSGFYLFASPMATVPKTLSPKKAREFCKVQTRYNDRIVPLQTLACDFTLKMTGDPKYKGFTPEQVFCGWLFFPEDWGNEPMIRVKNSSLQQLLKIQEYASYSDFFTEEGLYRLQSYWMGMKMGKPSPLNKAIKEVDEKIQLLSMLQSGNLLQIFPSAVSNETIWYSPASPLPATLDEHTHLFIKGTLPLLKETVRDDDKEQFCFIMDKVKAFQQKNGGTSVSSSQKIDAEVLYNRLPVTSILFKVNLTLGLLALIYFSVRLLRRNRNNELDADDDTKSSLVRKNKSSDIIYKVLLGLLVASFACLTFYIGLRAYISGRLPMSNGYETMVLLAWCIMLAALLFCRKFRFILSFGFLLSGFCLLVASIGRMNPQITQLVPVLTSPLLSLHVSVIMMSYALLAFTFLNGLLSLLLHLFGRKEENTFQQEETLQVMSQLFLYPAVFLLGAGIFIGAIWANVSWGRYWAWDPKEVWALITFLVYGLALHPVSMKVFRRPAFFHLYLCLAFFTVLMTYFGVNYFLGGMHSYN